MTAEEFVRSIKLRGLPGRKTLINTYIAEHQKESYDEDDLIDYAHYAEPHYLRRYAIKGLCADGQNKYTASNMK